MVPRDHRGGGLRREQLPQVLLLRRQHLAEIPMRVDARGIRVSVAKHGLADGEIFRCLVRPGA